MTRLRLLASAGLVASSTFLNAGAAIAGPITSDNFHEFSFTDAGVAAVGCDPADPAGNFCTPSSGTPTTFLDAPSWTFVAPAGGASLTVIDAFLSGDQFEIFDFGVSLGVTSLPVAGADCGDDPVPCLADASMSRGVFALAGGAHSLTISPTLSDGGGSAYLQVSATAVVPSPATPLLISAAFAGLWFGLRRRIRQ